ncbi:MAG: hypothetical protein H6807_11445 [Planctomycetes bacterium]|nr:hypothetical protein [Planctomycetota bacterium]
MRTKSQLALAVVAFVLVAMPLRGQSILSGPTGTVGYLGIYYFDLEAAKHLTVIGFEVYTTTSFTNQTVSVWKKKDFGSYVNDQFDPHAWELLVTKSLSGSSGYTLISTWLNAVIPAGETQAFMIQGPCKCDLTIPTGAVAASNADLTLYSGVGNGISLVGFHSPTANVGWGGRVRYNVHNLVSVDLTLDSFVSPVVDDFDCAGLGNSEVVAVKVRNKGTTAIPAGSLIPFALDVDGQPYVTDLVLTPSALAPGDTYVHTFSIGADLSNGFNHTLKATASLGGDVSVGNDQLTLAVQAGGKNRVTTLPWLEDFESAPMAGSTAPPVGWYQDPNDSAGPINQWWFTKSANGSLSGIYASLPSTTSYTIPASTTPAPMRLVSPCIDLGTAINPRLRFGGGGYINYQSLPDALMQIDVIRMSTGTIDVGVYNPQYKLWFINGDFQQVAVELGAYAGDVIQLVFRLDLSIGYPVVGPFFDNVIIEESAATPGQSIQRGLAEFYLDGYFNALNANDDPPYMQSGGPYFVSMAAGSQLSFDFFGLPNQPVLLLTGPLNPVAATYPNIGQMDIGGSPDPATGIPVGVQLIADGTDPNGLNPLFLLDSTGNLALWFTIPGLPAGPYATFQAAIYTNGVNGSWVALSEAIRLDIQ